VGRDSITESSSAGAWFAAGLRPAERVDWTWAL